ncbi:peptidoglycan DD-metalloendopeptidase family protein [Anaerovibrio sp.]|uniref:peptidoglycan DD-metalloendopeptidase family protein n=1 Tax=Anaerovibrio sp. TaxID=1872532 RepID=UPI00388D73E6
MRLIIVLLINFIFLLSCGFCEANSPVMQVPVFGGIITSPFGYRVHPVYGEGRGHKGVDIGVDYGTPVGAAAEGVVRFAGWDTSGFGYLVVIDHGGGVSSWYGHNSEVCVKDNQPVKQGQLIAYAGSTGISTGPHCHFEVREGNTPVPPGNYCPALKDAVVGDGVDGSSIWGAPMDEDFGAFNFDSEYDYGKPVRNVIEGITKACAEGLKEAKEPVLWLLLTIMTIDLVLSTGEQILDEKNKIQKLAKFALHKVLYYSFLIFLLFNWGSILGNGVRGFFTSFGAYGVGMTYEDAEALLSDPSAILSKGMHILAPVFDQMDSMIGLKILIIPGAMLTYVISLIFVIVLFILFTIIVFHIMKAHLIFYFSVLFSFCTWFFAGYKKTTQYASNGINAIFAAAVNLMFFAFFSLLLNMCLGNVSVEGLYNVPTAAETTFTYNELSDQTSLEEFMSRIRQVESSGNYYVWDVEHESFGAYQINVNDDNWNSWCVEYVSAGGILDTDMSMAKENEPPSIYPWTVNNQDRIAAYKMNQYYQQYGNWHDVATAWNGGEGTANAGGNAATEAYYAKVCGATSSSEGILIPTLNLLILLKILLIVLVFMFFGDRVHIAIMGAIGRLGFQLRTL